MSKPTTATPVLDSIERNAERYVWLRDRLLCADFAYGEPAECAIVFLWPERAAISADLDASIDAAQGLA